MAIIEQRDENVVMRSIWKGAISFGLVTIPVKVYSATEQKDVTFHQVHRVDGGRIKYRRVCTVDGEEVPYSDIAKGYELATGEMVVLTDEDFADLPLTTSRRIDVLQFSPADQIDPIYFAKSYYLEPESQGAKPYALLRDALERSEMVAIVKVALRQRESLATLRVRDGVFVLETMLWPDEVRSAEFPFLEEDVDVRPQELKMAESLIETMVADFDPGEYKDAYREALQEVIEAKVAGREVVATEVPAEQAPGVDLMAALRASVEAAKKEREGREDMAGPSKKAAGKSSATKARATQPAARKSEEGGEEEEKAPRRRKTRRSA
jgi:DNA end-binding protein Ku